MLRAYLVCALWSSIDEEGESLDSWADIDDINADTIRNAARDVVAFRRLAGADLQGISPSQAGRDFWLTRNRHGAGFWDRGLGERGERLSDAARSFGSVALFVGRAKPERQTTMSNYDDAVAFFYEHAGYSYDPETETPEQGRQRSAELLAAAERDAVKRGYEIVWAVDDDPIWDDDVQRETTDYDQYVCSVYDADGVVLASLGSVDFGPGVTPESAPYGRVVAAEVALEAMHADTTERADEIARVDADDVSSQDVRALAQYVDSRGPSPLTAFLGTLADALARGEDVTLWH